MLIVGGTIFPIAAGAQSYRCSTAESTYFSDRPCPGMAAPRITVYGQGRGAAAAPYYAPTVAPSAKMQEHVKYLSPQCASISEAIRTAPSRGVRGNTIADLQDEYRQKCQLEDQEARKQLGQAVADERRQQQAQRDVVAMDRKQNQVRADQCTGMRDVITTKRAREGTLKDSEVAALRSLEQTFNERCIAK